MTYCWEKKYLGSYCIRWDQCHECKQAYQRGYNHEDKIEPNYPVPAIPTRVEYVFINSLMDGIFVRVEDYIVCGAYYDGLLVEGYPPVPYAWDYPEY